MATGLLADIENRALRVKELDAKQWPSCKWADRKGCCRVKCNHAEVGGERVIVHKRHCQPERCKFYEAMSGSVDKDETQLVEVPELNKDAVLLTWGFKGAMEGLKVSLPKLGFHVHEIFRAKKPTWKDETIAYLKAERPELLITWQRFYKGTFADAVKKTCDSLGVRTLVLDFGLWPHYGSAFLDQWGENAESGFRRDFLALENNLAGRAAAEESETAVEEIRKTLMDRAHEAEGRLDELGLAGLPPGFKFLALQRTGDQVLRFDAPKARKDMNRVLWDVIREAAKSNAFVVAKTHPLDKEIKLADAELDGDNYRVIGKERWERLDKRPPAGNSNDLTFAWLLVNCSHFIVVNSTTLYQAMALGKPVSCLGKGWFTGCDVVAECPTIRDAMAVPSPNQKRVRRFLSYLHSRQLTIGEFKEPKKVQTILERYYPGLTGGVGAENVTAMLINYHRPSIKKTVRSIHEQGIHNIWLWFNSEPIEIEGVSRVMRCSDNIGNWQRFALAGMVDTEYVLFCDDDAEMTPAGLRGLLRAAARNPRKVVGLWGWRFNRPYAHYRKREEFTSPKLSSAVDVDMVSPCGMLAPKEAIQEAFGKVKYWNVAYDIFGDHTCDDLPLSLAFSECACGRPLVIPTEAPGFRFTPESKGKSSLLKAPGRKEKLYACLPRFIQEAGWQPMGGA